MASIPTSQSLHDLLAEQLPKDVPFTFYHYSTPPSHSPALYSAPPQRKPERTYCESHFLAASIAPRDASNSVPPTELLILAIEVLIYTTRHLTTIFVSKADSTGCIAALNLPHSQAGSPLKAICGTFVSWLAKERQREGKKLVISLFARAQDQYLFPASIDNANKHVLDDRGLVKWWCKVLDPIVREYAVEEDKKSLVDKLAESEEMCTQGELAKTGSTTAKGYLLIPGFETNETLRYIPPPPSPTAPRRWAASHPLSQLSSYPDAPPRCLVPHFPDDPKSRFLDELDEELPDRGSDSMSQPGGTPSRSNGQWKSVKTLEQFWEMMAFRQECSSGRIVGFIWVVVTPPEASIPELDEDEATQPSSSFESVASKQASPRKKNKSTPKKNSRRNKVNTESGPIPLRLPRIKSSSSNLSTMSASSGSSKLPPANTAYFKWTATSRGFLLFNKRDYDRAHEVLLQQNFATRAAAARSSKRWKDEIGVLGGVDNWGWTVVGKKEAAGPSVSATNGTAATPNTIIGVRKKRKDPIDDAAPVNSEKKDGVQTLSAGLVRKKVRVEQTPTTSEATAGSTNGVNMLGAGLVRKKPKA